MPIINSWFVKYVVNFSRFCQKRTHFSGFNQLEVWHFVVVTQYHCQFCFCPDPGKKMWNSKSKKGKFVINQVFRAAFQVKKQVKLARLNSDVKCFALTNFLWDCNKTFLMTFTSSHNGKMPFRRRYGKVAFWQNWRVKEKATSPL